MFLLGFLGLRILIQSFPTVIQHSSLYFLQKLQDHIASQDLEFLLMYRAACGPPAPEIGSKPFPITSSPTNVITPRVKSALKIVFLFSFCSFLSSFPLEVKGEKKNQEISRTIPGRHLGVNQTSSQSKLVIYQPPSTLLIESDQPSMHPHGPSSESSSSLVM